jgi:hypothetical protein
MERRCGGSRPGGAATWRDRWRGPLRDPILRWLRTRSGSPGRGRLDSLGDVSPPARRLETAPAIRLVARCRTVLSSACGLRRMDRAARARPELHDFAALQLADTWQQRQALDAKRRRTWRCRRITTADRLCRPGLAGTRGAAPGDVRPRGYTTHRARARPAYAAPALTGTSSGASDAGSRGLLALELSRCSERPARSLPETCLAR